MTQRMRTHAIASVVLWLAVIAAAWLYLAWSAGREPGSGDRLGTGGDSIALPMVGLGVWLALALLLLNVVAAIAMVVRRKRGGQ